MTELEFQSKISNIQETLLRIANSMTVDEGDASCLARYIFLKAIKFNDRFLFETNYKAWIYRIMANTLVNGHCTLKHVYTGGRGLHHRHYPYAFNNLTSGSPLSVFRFRIIENQDAINNDHSLSPFSYFNKDSDYYEITQILDSNLGTTVKRNLYTRKNLKEYLTY